MSIVRVTDGELVARARQGDPAAFGELVNQHRIRGVWAARAALGSHADAEDAAQDAFLAAFRRLGSLRGEASFKTWLLTIAWHQAINRRRSVIRILRRMVEPRVNDEGAPMMAEFVAAGPTPEESAAQGEWRGAIRDAITALQPKLRDALLLAQSGDHSYDEIAAMLGTPTGTIKWRVSEARRIVKQRLRERGHESVPASPGAVQGRRE